MDSKSKSKVPENTDTGLLIKCLRFCAISKSCPVKCPRYTDGFKGWKECHESLMLEAAEALEYQATVNDQLKRTCDFRTMQLQFANRRAKGAVEDTEEVVDDQMRRRRTRQYCSLCRFSEKECSEIYGEDCPGFESRYRV